MLKISFYETSITVISKSNKDITQKRKLQADTTHEHRCKYLQQNTSKPNSTKQQEDHIAAQVGFIPGIQGWVNICKSLNNIHYINKLKNKNHIIISINEEKAFDTIQHPNN